MYKKILGLVINFIFVFPNSSKELVGYDWSNHFGYAVVDEKVMWNQDWNAGPFFFDGIWSVNPGLMGPNIKRMFLNNVLDSSKFENDVTSTNFDYTQGDFLQDELSVSLKYFKPNNDFLKINGFKRSYAGMFNQYTEYGTIPKPIHQTYTMHLESKNEREKIGIALGYFNTLSALPADKEIMNKATYDSRISSNNIFWSRNNDDISYGLNLNHYLQRFCSDYNKIDTIEINDEDHTDSFLSGIRYLNREKREFFFNLNKFLKLKLSFNLEINSRGVKELDVSSSRWSKVLFGVENNNGLFLKSGFVSFKSHNRIVYDLVYNFNKKRFHLGFYSKKDAFPSHPYFKINNTSLESISFSSIHKAKLKINNSNFKNSTWISYNVYEGLLFIEENKTYEKVINSSFGNQMDWFLSKSYELSIKYTLNQTPNYLNDGVKHKFYFSNTFYKSTFNGALDLSLNMTLTGWVDRKPSWYLHLVESVPIQIHNESTLNDIWFLDLSISAKVSSFNIKYKWKNFSDYMQRLGYYKHTNSLFFHPMMPELRSQNSLKITWEFLD